MWQKSWEMLSPSATEATLRRGMRKAPHPHTRYHPKLRAFSRASHGRREQGRLQSCWLRTIKSSTPDACDDVPCDAL